MLEFWVVIIAMFIILFVAMYLTRLKEKSISLQVLSTISFAILAIFFHTAGVCVDNICSKIAEHLLGVRWDLELIVAFGNLCCEVLKQPKGQRLFPKRKPKEIRNATKLLNRLRKLEDKKLCHLYEKESIQMSSGTLESIINICNQNRNLYSNAICFLDSELPAFVDMLSIFYKTYSTECSENEEQLQKCIKRIEVFHSRCEIMNKSLEEENELQKKEAKFQNDSIRGINFDAAVIVFDSTLECDELNQN